MPDFDFQVEHALAEPYAATPTLTFRLKIAQKDGPATPVHAMVLRCQIRIEPARRKYNAEQQELLRDLFGLQSQWGQTLRPMLWTHANATVQAFEGSTTADMPVPCTYDFNVAATKYFDAIGDDGDIPLCLLFSGTVFYQSDAGTLQAGPISWDAEENFRLPARVWREMMDRHYPNCVFVCLRKDVFDRLRQFKTQSRHATWDKTIEQLLESVRQEKVSAG